MTFNGVASESTVVWGDNMTAHATKSRLGRHAVIPYLKMLSAKKVVQ